MLALAYTMLAFAPTPLAAPRCASVPQQQTRDARVTMEEGVASLEPTAAQKTWFPKAADMVVANKKWVVIDAEGLRLGRMASEAAKLLLGKHKATFTHGADVGDAVIIVNCEKVIVTGNKAKDKFYRRHSGRPGGMTIETFEELQARIPERIVEKAIVGMLPKNSHGRNLFRHLKVRAQASSGGDRTGPPHTPPPSPPPLLPPAPRRSSPTALRPPCRIGVQGPEPPARVAEP
jgi:large subunit ribosomal protein L13